MFDGRVVADRFAVDAAGAGGGATGEEENTSAPLQEGRAAREEHSRRMEEDESGSPAAMFSSEAFEGTDELVCLSGVYSSSLQTRSSEVVMHPFASGSPRGPFSSSEP